MSLVIESMYAVNWDEGRPASVADMIAKARMSGQVLTEAECEEVVGRLDPRTATLFDGQPRRWWHWQAGPAPETPAEGWPECEAPSSDVGLDLRDPTPDAPVLASDDSNGVRGFYAAMLQRAVVGAGDPVTIAELCAYIAREHGKMPNRQLVHNNVLNLVKRGAARKFERNGPNAYAYVGAADLRSPLIPLRVPEKLFTPSYGSASPQADDKGLGGFYGELLADYNKLTRRAVDGRWLWKFHLARVEQEKGYAERVGDRAKLTGYAFISGLESLARQGFAHRLGQRRVYWHASVPQP